VDNERWPVRAIAKLLLNVIRYLIFIVRLSGKILELIVSELSNWLQISGKEVDKRRRA
jgi:hypothetical protein